eukprot:Seg2490.3 transcript_id=Seg2490.3/GoldUCD/mRNA.D3Y31 product="hypothetical protein" protein_id=Seg2490.3/GoldUCD/D3Y31
MVWNDALLPQGEYLGKSSVSFLPMIDLDPSNITCIYSTLDFVSRHAKRYDVTPVLTFDQPLWWKATCIIKGEPIDSPLRQIILRLGAFHTEMSFLGSIGHLMRGGTSDGTLDVRVMILRSGVLKAMGSTGDKGEETGAGVGGDESSQEMDSYGIDRPVDSLKNQLEVLIEDRELIMVAMKDFIIELKDISEIDDGIDEQIESRIMELKLIVEPMLMDIKSVVEGYSRDRMKKLNLSKL